MKRTTAQNSKLHFLLCRLKIDAELKASLVKQYTQGRTDHSSQMEFAECQELINHLQAAAGGGNGSFDVLDVKRKRVISHLKEAGFTLPDGRADMPAIYAWVRKQKYKKPLNDLTGEELSKLIHAAAGVRDHLVSKF